MNPRSRKIAAIAATAVLAAGAGIGVAAQGSSSPASGGDAPGMMRQGGPGAPFDLSALASELGVSEARLQEAMEAARPDARGEHTDMAAALADELGLSTADVQAALEATMPQRGPGGAPPSDGGTAPPPGGETAPPSSSDGATTQS